MALVDTVNRIYREFLRYTGDGLPGEPTSAPLPVGDPQSGVYNPKKSELRAAFTELLTGIDAAGEDLAQFRKIYLGAKADDPALDNEGAPLIDGALYWNTVAKSFRAYDLSSAQWYATSFKFRGAWSAPINYVANDLTEHGGTIWLALRPNVGVEPVEGDDWTLFLPGVTVADGSITDAKIAPAAAIASSKIAYLLSAADAVTRSLADRLGDSVSVKDFGAKGDGKRQWAVSTINSGSNALSVTGGSFAAEDVGKLIIVSGAGASGGDLVTTIAGYTSPSSITLTANAGTTRTAVNTLIRYGTDDLPAFNKAVAAASSGSLANMIVIPRGIYFFSAGISGLARSGLLLAGAGCEVTSLVFCQNGDAMVVDAFASGSPSDPYVSMSMRGFTIEGHSGTARNLFIQGCAFSDFNLEAAEGNPATGIGFVIAGCHTNTWRLTVSSINKSRLITGFQQASKISEGIRVQAGTRAGLSVGSSTNNVLHITIDGCLIGVRLAASDNNVFFGASQANSTYGVLIASGCRANVFNGVALENLGSTADLADGGIGTQMIGCYGSQKILIQSTSRFLNIKNGMYEAIAIGAGARSYKVDGILFGYWFTGAGIVDSGGIGGSITNIYGLPITASISGTTLTVTAVPGWADNLLAPGVPIVYPGSPAGLMISALGTGTGGTGTYTLSANAGAVASRVMRADAQTDFKKGRTSITVGASQFKWRNDQNVPVRVFVSTGTVSNIKIARGGDNWDVGSATGNSYILQPNDELWVTYSSAPSMFYTYEP